MTESVGQTERQFVLFAEEEGILCTEVNFITSEVCAIELLCCVDVVVVEVVIDGVGEVSPEIAGIEADGKVADWFPSEAEIDDVESAFARKGGGLIDFSGHGLNGFFLTDVVANGRVGHESERHTESWCEAESGGDVVNGRVLRVNFSSVGFEDAVLHGQSEVEEEGEGVNGRIGCRVLLVQFVALSETVGCSTHGFVEGVSAVVEQTVSIAGIGGVATVVLCRCRQCGKGEGEQRGKLENIFHFVRICNVSRGREREVFLFASVSLWFLSSQSV